MEKLLTIKEVGEIFNVSSSTMYRLISSRKIPFYKIAGVLRFSRKDIEAFLEESKIEPVTY